MAADRLNQYRGTLNPQQIADGMNTAEKNAAQLLNDAELLLREERFPSATAIAILAIEEAGKNTILRQLSTAKDDTALKKAWKGYHNHKEKNLASIVPQLVAAGARRIDDFRSAFDGKGRHPAEVDALKQLAIYTDCLGKAHWSDPSEVVDKALAEQLVGAAKVLARERDHTHTAREVELWIEFMGPVMDQPLEAMKAALRRWYAAMREAGLTDTDTDAVESFIGRN